MPDENSVAATRKPAGSELTKAGKAEMRASHAPQARAPK